MVEKIVEIGGFLAATEVERWRREELDKLNSRKQAILEARVALRRPYYAQSAATPLAAFRFPTT